MEAVKPNTGNAPPKTRPTPETARKPRQSDKEQEPSEEQGSSGKIIAFVAVAVVALVACLGGAVVVGGRYLNPGTPEQTVAENNEKPREGPAVEKKNEAPTEQPKEKTVEKKDSPKDERTNNNEPPSIQPKDKLTEKKEAPAEQSNDTVTEKKGTPPEPKVAMYDFSKVDYKYDFSNVDYTKGPDGQTLTERSGEEKQQPKPTSKKREIPATTTPTTPIRFVEQGFYVEKQPTPEDIIDSACRLQDEWAARYPKANDIYLKRLKILSAKKGLPKLAPLPSVPLRPGITDFRYLTKDEAVVITKQQKATLFLVEGPPLSGNLHSLDSKEVQFQSAQLGAKLTKFEPSKVKAVQTGSDTYYYSTGKKAFVSLNAAILSANGEKSVALQPPGNVGLRIYPRATLLLVSGQQVTGALHAVTSFDIQFIPVGQKKMEKIKPADVKSISTDNFTVFVNPNKKCYVNLKTVLEDINSPIADGEIAEAWVQLRMGKMPANFEFLADGKPVDMNKAFVRHGKRKGEYVIKDNARIAYEDYWFNGIAHGSAVRYYPDGRKFEGVWVNGNLHGITKDYYDNGKLSAECLYRDGKKHGTEKTFHPNGQPNFQGSFVNGKPVGEHRSFHSDGKPDFQGLFVDGKPVGEHSAFDSVGRQYLQGKYVDGKPVGLHKKVGVYEIMYDANGIKDGISIQWNAQLNAAVKVEEGSYKAGKKIGVWTTWHLNGKKRSTETYLDDVLHGGQIQYSLYKEGQVIYTCQWANGQRNGKEVDYDPIRGNVSRECDWLNGRKHGWEIEYFTPTGSINKKTRWVNGVEQN